MPDYLPVLAPQRSPRAHGRELARLEARATLEVAQAQAIETIEVAKVQALGSIAQAVEVQVAQLTAAELALAEQHPYAFARLRAVGEVAAVEFAQRLHQANRRLG